MDFIKGDYVIVPNLKALAGQPATIQSVYFWICVHANEEGQCWPSANRIAKQAGVGRRTVFNALEKLLEIGVLEKRERKAGRENLSNVYTIIIQGGSAGDAPPSAGDALPSAGDALPSAGDAHRTISMNNNHELLERRSNNFSENPEPSPPPNSAAPPSPKFKKPALEEVEAYCKERRNSVDPLTFWNWYEANGWMVGRNRMKSWKAAVITWERRDHDPSKTNISNLPEL